MKSVTFNGPQNYLRISSTDRLLRSGVRTEVTNAEADVLSESPADVTFHRDEPDDD